MPGIPRFHCSVGVRTSDSGYNLNNIALSKNYTVTFITDSTFTLKLCCVLNRENNRRGFYEQISITFPFGSVTNLEFPERIVL